MSENVDDHAVELIGQLRDRACPAGLPWTGGNPEEDHGHTDCWFHHQSANKIEQLLLENAEYKKIIQRINSNG